MENKPGGGGIFGGPPGIGCCCNGAGCPAGPAGPAGPACPAGRAAGGNSFGSTSSHSEERSPELNLSKIEETKARYSSLDYPL